MGLGFLVRECDWKSYGIWLWVGDLFKLVGERKLLLIFFLSLVCLTNFVYICKGIRVCCGGF